jgi:hypothetical protein
MCKICEDNNLIKIGGCGIMFAKKWINYKIRSNKDIDSLINLCLSDIAKSSRSNNFIQLYDYVFKNYYPPICHKKFKLHQLLK